MKTKRSIRLSQIYLLRLERVQREESATWLAFLESVASGNRRAFNSLDALTDFLKSECAEQGQTRKPLSTVEHP